MGVEPRHRRRRAPRAVATVLVAGGLLASAACTDDGGPQALASSAASGTRATDGFLVAEGPPGGDSAVTVTDAHVRAAVEQLPGIVQRVLDETGVPGMAVAVVHDDEVVFSQGFGVKDVETGDPVDADTVFQLASVSKSVAATVVAGAVGEGIVAWDDEVVEHLPWFRLSDPDVTSMLTLADLFVHRSGLPEHVGDLLEDVGYDRRQVLERLAQVPLGPFRTEWAYTNFGLTAAGEAVAEAAGTSWEELSDRILYEPLAMTSTSSRHQDYLRADNRAVLHVREGDEWVARYDRQPDAQSPAGGVSSTVTDMAKWLRLQLASGTFDGERVVAEDPLLEGHLPHLVSGPDPSARSGFYGYGMNVGYDPAGRLRLSHSGAFAMGAATAYTMLPSEGLGIIALTNGMPIGAPEAVTASFMDLAEFGAVERDWLATYTQALEPLYVNPSVLADRAAPANPAPARSDGDYVGTYENAYYGTLEVVESAGGLQVVIGPARMTLPLTHWDGDDFSMVPQGENAVGPSLVTFAGSSPGATTSVRLEFLDGEGLGTFTRVG
jgi:CubicO group peptidase (beta-lactamase class C family)